MKMKFENHSVSGIFREYGAFAFRLPGHTIGDKAVIVDVPEAYVADIQKYLTNKHPAVRFTAIAEEPIAPVADSPVVVAQTEQAETEAGGDAAIENEDQLAKTNKRKKGDRNT